MAYIDGFVIPLPKSAAATYRDYAARYDPIFKDYGALAIVEAIGDDVPHGTMTDFYRAVAATADETVIFSWIIWPDKATRDAGNARVMEDPRMKEAMATAPFDGARMIFGGFDMVLNL
jgi:uncharacterized protein YbaA (DUF1428 family)